MDTNDSNNILLNSIVKLVIASDYDSRERRLDNYASILDVNSNPTILIQIDPINETLLFTYILSIKLIFNLKYSSYFS